MLLSRTAPGRVADPLAAASSVMDICSVTTETYTPAVINAISSKLFKNKSSMACGLPVGYDLHQIYETVVYFVKCKNILIETAGIQDLKDYLNSAIPKKTPGKGKARNIIPNY